MEGVFAELQERYEQRGIEVDELISKVAIQFEQIQNLNSLNQELIAKVASLEKEVSKMRAQGSILQQLNDLSQQLADKETVNLLLQNEKKIFVNKMDSMKKQIKALEAELNELRPSRIESNFSNSNTKPLLPFQTWNDNIVSFFSILFSSFNFESD